jgi:hypothetical protein
MLRGLLGGAAVAVGLPLLDLFVNKNGDAMADGSAFPCRFGLFFWGNGMIPAQWVPSATGQGAEWELSDQLSPLAPMKDMLSVVTGTNVRVPNVIPHGAGPGGILSGAPITVNNGEEYTLSQPSIDQVLATEFGSLTAFRSIEVGIQPGSVGRSFNGPHSQNPPETSPIAMYQRLFGDDFVQPGDEPIIDPKIALRRSVLDAVMEDSSRLRARVGAGDRVRLEQHFDGIRDLELRLQRLEEDPPSFASCTRPTTPEAEYPDVGGRPPLLEINAAMADIIAMALACDQTRVFSVWFSEPIGNVLYPGATSGHHQLTHDEGGEQPQVNMITQYIMQGYNDLLVRLRAVPEGAQTLLDHSAVLATSDVSYGRQHKLEDFPILIGGSANGYFKTDQHYRSLGENSSAVLLGLLRSQGMNLAEYGVDAGLVNDSLTAIEA